MEKQNEKQKNELAFEMRRFKREQDEITRRKETIRREKTRLFEIDEREKMRRQEVETRRKNREEQSSLFQMKIHENTKHSFGSRF